MPYGQIKVDEITFTNAGVDQTISVSGVVASISGNITATGTISGNVIRGGTLVSGATVTGTTAQFTTVTGGTAGFTTITGTTVTGTTANFTSGNFTNISGGTHTITSGVFASGTAANPSISFIGDADTGIYASAANQVSITTSGTERLRVDVTGQIESASLGTAAAPAYSFTADPNTGIYSPGADQVAISTNGTRRLNIDSSGNLVLDTGDATIYGVRVGRGAGAISTNTAVGASSLNSNTTGSQNTAIGNLALTTNTTGQYNTALGVAALNTNNASNNTAVGRVALYFNSSGGSNVAVGHEALYNNTTGDRNVCIGSDAGNDLTTGDNNTIIGSIAGTAGLSNTVIIGAGSTERMRLDSSGRLGLGTSSPAQALDVRTATGNAIISVSRNSQSSGQVSLSLGGGTSGTDWVLYQPPSSNDLRIFGSSADRVTVTSNGNVGIGNTSPSSILHCTRGGNGPTAVLVENTNSGGVAQARFEASNGTALAIFGVLGTNFSPSGALTANETFIYTDVNTADKGIVLSAVGSAGVIKFATGGTTEKARIDSSGRLGLGTSSPGAKLQVSQNTDAGTAISVVSASAQTVLTTDFASLSLQNTNTTNNNYNAIGFVNDQGAYSSAIYGIYTSHTSGSQSGALAFSTRNAGTFDERMRITAAGNVGIGTTSPTVKLQIDDPSDARITVNDTGSGSSIQIRSDGTSSYIGTTSAHDLRLVSHNSERARIDSSGRLLVGTSSARSNFFNSTDTALVQVEGANNNAQRYAGHIYGVAGAGGPWHIFAKHRSNSIGGTTVVIADDQVGALSFQGSDGTEFVEAARIEALVDGTPGSNDMPGRLVLSTTRDGASSPTEAARITNAGYFKATSDGTYNSATGTQHEFRQNASGSDALLITSTNASLAAGTLEVNATRAANTAYNFFRGWSSSFGDLEFNLRGDGNAFADGTWSGGGADYAEYFEWSDGNPDEEDRRGISVVLDGDKIRPAVDGEDPIGVISGNPSVVGDAAWNKWSGKYLRDDYGTYIQENYEVVNDEGETVVQQRRKLNPAYDPDQEYVNREQRPEWDCVGLMGKLRIRKGQPTGSRWIKMRDISDSVEEWLVR
jgi:hypothetical protein